MSSHFILFFKFEFVFVINGSTEGGKVQGQAKKNNIQNNSVCSRFLSGTRALPISGCFAFELVEINLKNKLQNELQKI